MIAKCSYVIALAMFQPQQKMKEKRQLELQKVGKFLYRKIKIKYKQNIT